MLSDETIAAIATPAGEGGVGIIRISGKRALEIGSAVFQSADGMSLVDRDANAFSYGSIQDKEGVQIDAGLALVMRAPKVLPVKIRLSCKDMVVLSCFDEFCGEFWKLVRVWRSRGSFRAELFEWTNGSNASSRFI